MSFVRRHGLWSDEQQEAATRLRRIVEEQKLEVIRLSFPDQHGILRGKTLVASEALEPGKGMPYTRVLEALGKGTLGDRRIGADIVAAYELESHHLRLLQAACESWDRLQAARVVLDRDGISYVDRFNAPRARPEVAVERDAKVSFARLVRELNLDGAPGPDAPRPPAINR